MRMKIKGDDEGICINLQVTSVDGRYRGLGSEVVIKTEQSISNKTLPTILCDFLIIMCLCKPKTMLISRPSIQVVPVVLVDVPQTLRSIET